MGFIPYATSSDEAARGPARVSLFTRSRRELEVRRARRSDGRPVLEFLNRAPAENVLLCQTLLRDGMELSPAYAEWHLAYRQDELHGVCYAGANVIPAVSDREAARALGESLGRIRWGAQSLVGERLAVNAIWEQLGGRAPAVRLVREEQPFYVRERGAGDGGEPPLAPGIRLRLARSEDLDLLVAASADMLREEILDDPCARDPEGFRAQVWRMIRAGAIYVLEARHRVVFKAHVNVRTPDAVQVSGVYTVPPERGKGYGRAGMEALAQELLRECPRVCLYVNADNVPAIRTYEGAGFRRVGTFKSVFFRDPR